MSTKPFGPEFTRGAQLAFTGHGREVRAEILTDQQTGAQNTGLMVGAFVGVFTGPLLLLVGFLLMASGHTSWGIVCCGPFVVQALIPFLRGFVNAGGRKRP